MIRTKSCRCVMFSVTSLLIRLTILETYNYFPLNIHIELSPPLSSNIHTEFSYFPWFINSDRTYIPNNVISLVQTLNPQHNYFPLKTRTSDYHYPETSKSHTNLCHNSITPTCENTIKTITILHETTGMCGQDPMLLPHFFNIDFFFILTAFCNFLCITVWHIYNQTVVSIHTGFLTTVWLFLLYICHTVIHRKLQNVVYMKKIDVKEKRGGGQSEAPYRVLSTSTCVLTRH